MLKEQLGLLYPLVAVLLATAVLVLYVHYTSARHYRIKLLLGPALLAASIFAVPSVGARLGYGWPAPLPASFQYIAHKTVVVEGEKRWIDVLVVSRKPLRPDARLHRIRWTPPLEKVLEQAQQMKEDPRGGEIVVNGPPGSASDSAGDPGYSAMRVLPQDRIRKGPPTPPPARAPELREEQRRAPAAARDYLT